MATKRKRETKYDPPKEGNAFVGFVNVAFGSTERAAFDEWLGTLDPNASWDWLQELIENDYKFSLKRDTYGGGCQASLTCALKSSPDLGLVLTGRGPDVYNAMLVLMFKATKLLVEDWIVYFDQSSTVDVWG